MGEHGFDTNSRKSPSDLTAWLRRFAFVAMTAMPGEPPSGTEQNVSDPIPVLEDEHHVATRLPEATLLPADMRSVKDVRPSEVRAAIEAVTEFPIDTFLDVVADQSGVDRTRLAKAIGTVKEINVYSPDVIDSVLRTPNLPLQAEAFLTPLKPIGGRTTTALNGAALIMLNVAYGKPEGAPLDMLQSAIQYALNHELLHVLHPKEPGGDAEPDGTTEVMTYSWAEKVWCDPRLRFPDRTFNWQGMLYDHNVYGDVLFAVGHQLNVPIEEWYLTGVHSTIDRRLHAASGTGTMSALDRRVKQRPPVMDGSKLMAMASYHLVSLPEDARQNAIAEINQSPDYDVVFIDDGQTLGTLVRDVHGVVRNGWLAHKKDDLMHIRSLDGRTQHDPVMQNDTRFEYAGAPAEWAGLSDADLRVQIAAMNK